MSAGFRFAPPVPASDAERQTRRRRFRRAAFALAVLAAAATFPFSWGAALASRLARHMLDGEEPGSASCEVAWISPFRLVARDIRLGAVPGEPRLARLEARYAPWGLLRGRVASLRADGAEWDVGALLPEPVRAVFPDGGARGGARLRWKSGSGYAGTLEAEVLGGSLHGSFASDSDPSRLDAVFRFVSATNAALRLPDLRAEATAWIHGAPATNGVSGGVRPAFTVDSAVDTNAPVRTEARLWAEGSTPEIRAEASLADGAFAAEVILPAARLSEADPLVASFLAAFVPPEAPRLRFSGEAEGRLVARRARGEALPAWESKLRLRNVAVAADIGETVAALEGGNVLLRADGLGPHADIRPFGIRFRRASFDRWELDQGDFWFRADASSLLLTSGAAGWCGGKVRVYALHFNLATLDAGFTLFLDDLDAGRVLSLFPQAHGTATGRLHGKLPLALRSGRRVVLQDSFLYSPPGQVGKLYLDSAPALVEKLRETGIPGETCRSLEAALRDLDYDVLRFDLTQDAKTGEGRLSIRLHGTAGSGKAATPVDLNLSFNGQLEDLVNVGLRSAGL